MPLTAQLAAKVASRLVDREFDVAAGMSEATLTDFLDAHWATEESTSSSIYQGAGRAEELGISWRYHITKPATIDVSPIQFKAFSSMYDRWLSTVPELARFRTKPLALAGNKAVSTLSDNPPANVQVRATNIQIGLSTDTGINVNFEFAIVVTGFLEITNDVNGRLLRIVPIDARVTEQGALRAAVRSALPPGALKAQTVNGDCVELERLILYIINVLLANRIGGFVKEFSLPVPIKLVEGVALTSVELEIVDDLVVLLGILGPVTSETTKSEPPEAQLLAKPRADELRQMGRKGAAAISVYAADRTKVVSVVELKSMAWPARGIFLILHERLFQAILGSINVYSHGDECRGMFGFSVCYGYWMRLWGLVCAVTNTGLNVAGEFRGRAWLKACISTHCGDECAGVNAEASAQPKIACEFSFEGEELWVSARPGLFFIDWSVGGLPWPFSKLVEWFLEILTGAAAIFVQIIGYKFRQRLTAVPSEFPGTELAFRAKFDRSVIKVPDMPALLVVGEVDFIGVGQ